MFQAQAPAKLWQTLADSVAAVADEAALRVTPEGFSLRVMDPSRIALVEVTLPKSSMTRFECDKELMRLDLNWEEFQKLLKRGKDVSIAISAKEDDGKDPSTLNVSLQGKYTRVFSLKLIDLRYEEIPKLNLQFDVQAKLKVDALKEILQDATAIGDMLALDATASGIAFGSADPDGRTFKTLLAINNENLAELRIVQPTKSAYALEYLTDFIKGKDAASSLALLEFSHALPMRLTFGIGYGLGQGTIVYYLAPRVEEPDFEPKPGKAPTTVPAKTPEPPTTAAAAAPPKPAEVPPAGSPENPEGQMDDDLPDDLPDEDDDFVDEEDAKPE